MSGAAIPTIGLDEAWTMLADDPASVLIDVRTEAEWAFVGVPSLETLDKTPRLVQWSEYPSGQQNPNFVQEAAAGLNQEQAVLLLCRSGARSAAAASALREAGFSNVYNVVAGFEGDLDGDNHRQGGWKQQLPWRQR